jgi:hypothetical protein
VTKLHASGSALVYSTFLGGKGGDDIAYAIAVDSAGAAYVAGYTRSRDFPTTPGAFDTSWDGYGDAFVTKVDIDYCSPAEWSNYGAGWPGTLGIPTFTSSANPSLGSTITLSIGNSLGANTTGVLAIGLTQASLGTGFGGTLLLLPMSFFTISIPAAGLSVPGPIPTGRKLVRSRRLPAGHGARRRRLQGRVVHTRSGARPRDLTWLVAVLVCEDPCVGQRSSSIR